LSRSGPREPKAVTWQYKMRIEVAKGFVIDPEAAGHIIPEVADDHVGRPAELLDDGLAFRRSEIHNDVPLIPVQGQARL